METTTEVVINTILVLTNTFILRRFLYNVDLILSGINEPIIHIVDSGKEFSVVVEEVGKITRKGTLSENFTESIEVYDADWNFLREDHNDLGTTDIAFSPDIIANSMFNFNWKQFSASFNSQFVGRQYIDNTSCKDRSIDPYFVSNLRVGYVFKPKFMKEIALDVTINNLFNEQYETNAWVYSAMVDGERYKEDGYFTQAGTNAMARVTFKF